MAVIERQRRRRRGLRRAGGATVAAAVVVGLVFLLSGSSPKKVAAGATGATGVATTTTTAATTTTTSNGGAPPTCPPASGAAKRVIAFSAAPGHCIGAKSVFNATVTTDVGTFVFQMKAASSYAAVNNFVFLARYHYFDGIKFHRVIPGFMIQGGDPTGSGEGGPGYSFTGNTPPSTCGSHCYALGAVVMANTGAPTSDGSQFFVVAGAAGESLNPVYTTFGQVTSGMSVVQRIDADGDSADNGTPPKVTHHMIRVTVQQIAA